jgi:hypothetical protein
VGKGLSSEQKLSRFVLQDGLDAMILELPVAVQAGLCFDRTETDSKPIE